MKILIINLDSEKERMAFQRNQMLRLGLEFERLSAFTKNDIDPEELTNRASQWERPMREAEIACLFSHRAAWKLVAAGKKPMLILEDDALLSSNVPDILASLESCTMPGHVTLEVRGRRKLLGTVVEKLGKYANITRLYQDRSGAAAYVLWPHGAKILLNNSDCKSGLADAIISSSNKLSSWQIEPAAAFQLDQCSSYCLPCPLETNSTIYSEPLKSPTGMISFAKFKLRRIASQLRMGLRELSNFPRVKRRFVKVNPSDFQDDF